ncbi:MAG: hypothetical protein LC123_02455 [Burkholderiales bacterium]|nr:hypothetical protein [Burkholderiales bacterium]
MRTDDATMEQQEKDVVAVMAELAHGGRTHPTTPDIAAVVWYEHNYANIERTRRVLKRLEKQGAVDSEQRIVGGRWTQVWWLTEGAR